MSDGDGSMGDGDPIQQHLPQHTAKNVKRAERDFLSQFRLRGHLVVIMNTDLALNSEVLTDIALVDLSLRGDRDAFGQIVARYQGAICALAYSACGNVARSEDVAQEVFIAAWQKLSTIKQPSKFKAWLYGIARNLIHNTFRQQKRNPVGTAELLNTCSETLTSDEAPDQEAITREEETLLWHVLSGLPQVYREPLVLFYRHNESVSCVADALGLSEEAVRQRLSRGRALLQDRVAGVVKSGLRRSSPTGTFAASVIAALPVLATTTTAKGAVMGLAATNSAGGQTPGALVFLKSVGVFATMVALPAAIGGYFGQKLGRDSMGETPRRQFTTRFWRMFSIGLALLVLAPFLLVLIVTPFLDNDTRSGALSVLTFWLGLAYLFVPGALLYWLIWRRKDRAVKSLNSPDSGAINAQIDAPSGRAKLPRLIVGGVTAAAVGVLVFCYADMNHNVGHPPAEELQRIISEASPSELKASILVSHLRSIWGRSDATRSSLWLEVRRPEGTAKYSVNADDAALALLKGKGIAYPTYIEGRDFAILGMPGRFLPFLAAFVLGLGGMYLLRRRIRHRQESENE